MTPPLFLLLALNFGQPARDSLPSLHTFKGDDIDTVIASYKAKTITVKLRSGETYVYPQDSWSKELFKKYIKQFCASHRDIIRKEGRAAIWVQFTVDHDGLVYNVELMGQPPSSALAALAIEAIEKSPTWQPGTQNGHRVVCYQRQQVNLE